MVCHKKIIEVTDMDVQIFKDQLRKKGLKLTNQRLMVLGTMADHPGEHLTAEEIYDLVRQTYPEIGLATIYRTVQVLVDLQMIDKVCFDDGYARYELGMADHDSKHHHHHAICNKCGKVFSFEDDLLDNLEHALRESKGFCVTDHEVKLYGYCKDCNEKEDMDGNE